jgi:D-alanyl-lipoteichoic acid acyltransferase DltB (MBOAT superfamily)
VLQLAVVVGMIHWLQLEGERDFTRPVEKWLTAFDPVGGGLLTMLAVAFLVHAQLPARWQMPFFLVVSLAGILKLMGWQDGLWLISFGLILVGCCHLPLPHGWRVATVLLIGFGLGLLRAGVVSAPFSGAVLPVLGAMFMFRIIVYLYDLKNERIPVDPWRRLSYFFLAPNVCFPLFPVVDYATYLRTWRNEPDLVIYQKGVLWMSRGAIHLVLYRLVYQYFSPGADEVEDLGGVLIFVVSSYLLYLRISGQFHLIIGTLCLFGFNLPETHHRYLLASGFSDYWRRINIYWKDFMMKLVFYPCYVRFKKHGHLQAIALGTAAVFLVTWFLHSYQWFWLRGAFFFSVVDGLFWGIFALLVIINALREAMRPPQRKVAGEVPRFRWTQAARVALQTAGMFALICLLFSFWQSNSISEFFGVIAQAGNTSVSQVAAILGIIIGALGIGVLMQWIEFRGWDFWADAKRSNSGWFPAIATVGPLMIAPSLASETCGRLFGGSAREVVATIRGSSLNERDRKRLDRGYYEGLLQRETFGSQLWEVRLEQSPDWQPMETAGRMTRRTGDILFNELIPENDTEVNGVRWITNRWAMHDHDRYELEKPDGVYRIAMLSASYGAGYGMQVEQTFENLAEEALNRHPGRQVDRIEILNFSVPGYTLIEFVAFLETRIAPFQPDAFYFVTHSKEGPRTLGTLARRIREKVPLTFEYLEELKVRAEIPENPTDQDMRRLSPFRDEIVDWGYGRMADFCRAHRMHPVWIHLPATDETVDQEMLEAQRRKAEEQGFVTFGLDGAYGEGDRSDIWLFPHDRHPNAEGHRRIATKLLDELLKNREALRLPLTDEAVDLDSVLPQPPGSPSRG